MNQTISHDDWIALDAVKSGPEFEVNPLYKEMTDEELYTEYADAQFDFYHTENFMLINTMHQVEQELKRRGWRNIPDDSTGIGFVPEIQFVTMFMPV